MMSLWYGRDADDRQGKARWDFWLRRFPPKRMDTMAAAPNVIEVKAGDIAEELKRRGISSDEPVTLTIEPNQELIPGRRESRARVVAAGLSDDDIDRLIKRAQHEVE